MKNEEEKTIEINISKFVFVALNILPPLVLGKFFGVTAERFAYGLVILRLCSSLTDVLDSIRNYARFVEFMEGDDDD